MSVPKSPDCGTRPIGLRIEAFARESGGAFGKFLGQACRFGITSGYIRGQRLRTAFDYAHFDVIVYDQIESPVLWIDSNPDKSPAGRARIIPAEHVRAVFEVKAAFTRRTVGEAVDKLAELTPLMAGIDAGDEPYPTYLSERTVLATLFFELRTENQRDLLPFDTLKKMSGLPRLTYGPVILSGEGRSDDDTALG